MSRVALIGSFNALHNAVRLAIPWPAIVVFPEVNARPADVDLFGDFGNRQATPQPSVTNEVSEIRFASQCNHLF